MVKRLSHDISLMAFATALALTFVLLSGCAYNVSFKGEALKERKSGINVTPDDARKIIAVTSSRNNYSLILPYSEEWLFTWREGYLLIGKAGNINADLLAVSSKDSPRQYLEDLRRKMTESDSLMGLESAEIIPHRGQYVLVAVMDGEEALVSERYNGLKHLNVFTVRKWRSSLYLLHLSISVPPDSASQQTREQFLDFATAGFSVSYMRDLNIDDGPGFDTPWRRGGARRRE